MSEQDRLLEQRIKKRDAIVAMGVDPYGGRFDGVRSSADIRREADPLNIAAGERSNLTARVAGRIALLRVMGKLAFLTIRDASGTFQLGISQAEIGEPWNLLEELDLSDIVGADGIIGRTKTNELTLWCNKLTLLCKSLQPPPEKWHGLTDVDLRYRRRYVDLFANPEVREIFGYRSAINAHCASVINSTFLAIEHLHSTTTKTRIQGAHKFLQDTVSQRFMKQALRARSLAVPVGVGAEE